MSTQPTEPGNYHWRAKEDHRWLTVKVYEVHPGFDDPFLASARPGVSSSQPLDYGIFGPRIPDPDEPRAEPAGGLTDAEIDAGFVAYSQAHGRAMVDLYDKPVEVFRKLSRKAGIAAFRRAIAETRGRSE